MSISLKTGQMALTQEKVTTSRALVLILQSIWNSGAKQLFSYNIPSHLLDSLFKGMYVSIPFGERLIYGIIWNDDSSDLDPSITIREIESVIDEQPILSTYQMKLAEWITDYYCCSLNSAVALMLPIGLASRSKVTLHLTEKASTYTPQTVDEQALLGLLQDKPVDIELIYKALGKKKAKELVNRFSSLELISQISSLTPYRQVGVKRKLQLAVDAEAAKQWIQEQQEKGNRKSMKQIDVVDTLLSFQSLSTTEIRKLTKATDSALEKLIQTGIISYESDEPASNNLPVSKPHSLNRWQEDAVNRISTEMGTHLLYGITGSGKTEVYLQALKKIIDSGRQGILLVPEISLTPQMQSRVTARFPGKAVIIHSGLPDGERFATWQKIRSGAVDVVVGSRSALFAPLPNPGLIILDEEHDPSYKQGERPPTYHAREAAIKLGELTGSPVVLGSATPSIETYALAEKGEYHLHHLPERPKSVSATDAPQLPSTRIIDLRAELRAGNTSILSKPLLEAIADRLAKKEQIILFLNRRGTASCVLCRDCGYVAKCDRCDVPMTYHKYSQMLQCHYCGRYMPPPAQCPQCLGEHIRYFGLGTERIQDTVSKVFPEARTLRWDKDTARDRLDHEQLLNTFLEHKADILIGTQMIAKGLDIAQVTLVGVISADIALYIPDLRASERAFQTLTQVSGRAGRGDKKGEVIIQTFNPENFIIQTAAQHDYPSFYEAEIAARKMLRYPPYRHFAKLSFAHHDRYTCQVETISMSNRLSNLIAEMNLKDTDLVGPAPSFIEYLRGKYHWQILVRGPDLQPLLHQLLDGEPMYGWSWDVDPLSIF